MQLNKPPHAHVSRRHLLRIAGAGALASLLPSKLLAASYPSGPITIVIPLPAGGVTDVLARGCGERFNKDLGYPFVVENVPGATSNIGVSRVARARPDGQTLLLCPSSPISTNVVMFKSLPFDPDKDLEPVVLTSANSIALTVHRSFPATNVEEYIAYAKTHPGEVTYGSSGVGSPHYFCAEYLASIAGVKLNHIPFKGTAESSAEVAAGHIQSAFTSLGLVTEQVRAGNVRILAITDDKRAPTSPEIPTVSETLHEFTHAPGAWNAIFVPAGTPKEIRDILNHEFNVALSDPEFVQTLQKSSIVTMGGTPEALTEKIKFERKIAKDIADRIGLVPQ